ncbi:MAG: hypothetical protein IPP18_16910 [Rhodocyclaceae bacterium]|nr:hypothetical protein [Rhodocyclaceae bacterium]
MTTPSQAPRRVPHELAAQSRRVAVLLALGVIALNAVVIALGARGLFHSRAQTVTQVRETTANLAALLEGELSGTFRRIDLSLQTIADTLEHLQADGQLDDAAINRMLDTHGRRHRRSTLSASATPGGRVLWGKGVDPAAPISTPAATSSSRTRRRRASA